MTRKELERMISLADDRYIEELFSARIDGRKNFSPFKIISAAAVISIAIASAAIAAIVGNTPDINDLKTIVTEAGTEFTDFGIIAPDGGAGDSGSSAQPKRIMPIDYDENFDYGVYFKLDRFDGIIDYTLEAGGQNYYFKSDYIYETVPFDTLKYDEPRTAAVFCDESGRPVSARIYCVNSRNKSHRVEVVVTINDDGALFPDYWHDDGSVFDDAPERFGVKIAGGTSAGFGSGYNSVYAVFRVNGIGYTVDIYNMTYAEAVGVIDSLIETNLKAADFDISMGMKQKLTLEEANELDPYAGYVVTSDKIGEMSFVNCERNRDIKGENLFIYYNHTFETQTWSVSKYISLNYYTNTEVFEENIRSKGSADDLYGDIDSYKDHDLDFGGEQEFEGDLKNYVFNFTLDRCYLHGEAVCTEEELTEYLEQLRYQSYIAAQASNDGVEIYNDVGVPPVCADYLYDYWNYAFKLNYGELNGSGFDPEKYFTDPDMLKYAGAELTELAHTENSGIISFKIISHGASGGTTKDGREWVKINYDVDVDLSKDYTGNDYYRAKSAYMGRAAYFEYDYEGGANGKIQLYRAFDLNDLRALGIDKNNAKYPLDIDMDKLLKEVGADIEWSWQTTSVPVGHRDASGVSFTEDVKGVNANITFSYPSDWQINNNKAEMNGKKIFEIGAVWFASEGFVPEDYKVDLALGREVTVIGEEYGDGSPYDYVIHRSIPDYYSDNGLYENYLYIVKSGDFYVTVSFVVNEYLPDAECRERIMESVQIKSASTKLSLSDANKTKPFTGYVPQLEKFGDITLTNVSYDKDNGRLDVEYGHERDNVETAASKYINLHYYTDDYSGKSQDFKHISFDEITQKKVVPMFDVDKTLKRYKLRILCKDFYIEIWAVCTPDEMWKCLSEIRREYDEFPAQLSSAYGTLFRPVSRDIPIRERYSEEKDKQHKGVDFAAPEGTKVYAAADGTVISGKDMDSGYGTLVMIDHGKGLTTVYAHLSKAKVKVGDKVKKGDVIGLSGKTGTAVGDTLHFEVRVNGNTADPELFLEPEVPSSAETVSYNGREFARSKLSKETLDWLDWYNSLAPDEQLAISYVPAELS